MTLIELKKGLIETMQTIFPKGEYKYYSKAVTEGYERPSFFVTIRPLSMEPSNYNSRSNRVAVYINYMQEVVDEADALAVIQELRELFGLSIRIGDRYVDVDNFDFDFVGKEETIPEISIELSWFDRIKRVIDAPLMESVQTNIKNMEE